MFEPQVEKPYRSYAELLLHTETIVSFSETSR